MFRSVFFTAALVATLALTGCKSETEKKKDDGNAKIAQMNTLITKLNSKGVYTNLKYDDNSVDELSRSQLSKMSDSKLDETIAELDAVSSLASEVLAIIADENITYNGDENDLRRLRTRASNLSQEGKSVRAERIARSKVDGNVDEAA